MLLCSREMMISTEEIDDETSVGASACGASEEGLSVGKLPYVLEGRGAGNEQVSGVANGVSEVEYCINVRTGLCPWNTLADYYGN